MEKLEKVELVREKTGVGYQEARAALEANGYDVLGAITWLEAEAKTAVQTASFVTDAAGPATHDAAEQIAEYEVPQAQDEPQEERTTSTLGKAWANFCTKAKELFREGMDRTFVAERNGSSFVEVPLLLVVLGLFLWGATLWLLVIGLFLGMRYRIEGVGTLTVDVNEAMDKVADAAESIKHEFARIA